MAKGLLVSVAIGAVLQGSYLAAFSGAKRTLETLDATSAKLKKQHDQMGAAMKRAVGTLSGGSLAAICRRVAGLPQAHSAAMTCSSLVESAFIFLSIPFFYVCG